MSFDALLAARAYGAAAGAANPSPPGAGSVAGGADFGALVKTAISETEGALGAAETLSARAAVGQAPLVDVVTAVAAAEVTLETVVAVRDQVVRAYQEIMRMPI